MFITEAHAELELEKLKIWTKLRRYAEDHNPVPLDWDNEEQQKYTPYIAVPDGVLADQHPTERYSPLQIFTLEKVCIDAVEYIGGIEKLIILLEQ